MADGCYAEQTKFWKLSRPCSINDRAISGFREAVLAFRSDRAVAPINLRIGRYAVIADGGRDKGNNALWYLRCECGVETLARASRMRQGYQPSCACVRPKIFRGRSRHLARDSLQCALLDKLPTREPGECWPWSGAIGSHGYGALTYRRQQLLSHRASYTAFVGPVPDGLDVLHTCDNRPCCNPAHLFLGNDQMNAADKVAKKRHLFGEDVNLAKLTRAQVRYVLSRPLSEDQCLADRFGVTLATISRIRRGETWVLGRE